MSTTTEATQVKPPFPPQEIGPPPGEEVKMSPRPVYEADTYRAAEKLKGQVALITGGDSGIGRSVAVLFAREGADIAFTYMETESQDAKETVKAIEKVGRRAYPLSCDLRQQQECSRIVQKTVEHFGKLDILVNNAAFQKHQDQISDVTNDQWDQTFQTNIYAYFYMVQSALRHLKEGATIINTGSITGLDGSPHLIDYSATKGAIHAFTKSLAQSLAKRKIRVNCVAPGPVWTPLNPAERSDEETRTFGKDTPFGRPAQPCEIAPTYVFLASNADSSYITGEIITLLGGDTTAG